MYGCKLLDKLLPKCTIYLDACRQCNEIVCNWCKGQANKTLKLNFQAFDCSPDGKHIVFARGEQINSGLDLFIYDPVKEKQVGAVFKGKDNPIVQVKYSPNGKYIASFDTQYLLRVWNSQTHKQISAFLVYGFGAIEFSPNSENIVMISENELINVYSCTDGDLVDCIDLKTCSTCVQYSYDGQLLFIGQKNKVLTWSLKRDRLTKRSFLPEVVHYTKNILQGRFLICSTKKMNIRIQTKDKGKQLRKINNTLPEIWTFDRIKIEIHDEKMILKINEQIFLSSLITAKLRLVSRVKCESDTDIQFSPDGKYILYKNQNQQLEIQQIHLSTQQVN